MIGLSFSPFWLGKLRRIAMKTKQIPRSRAFQSMPTSIDDDRVADDGA